MTQPHSEYLRESSRILSLLEKSLWPITIAVVVAYLLQSFSPIRLNNDNVILLLMAESYLSGAWFTLDGKSPGLPIGYPFVVALLRSVGVATPQTLVALNIIFLLSGTFFFYRIILDQFVLGLLVSRLLALAVLLNFLFIKYTALPQTELAYFFLSAAALYCAHITPSSWTIRLLFVIATLCLAAMAFYTRSIGLALIAPAIVTVVRLIQVKPISIDLRSAPREFFVAGIFLAALLLVLSMIQSYWAQWSVNHLTNGPEFVSHLLHKLSSLSQIISNLPDRIGNALTSPLAPLGLLAGVVIGIGFWTRIGKFSPVDFYFLACGGIIVAWPFYQTRFWLPIVPILFAYFATGLTVLWRWRMVQVLTWVGAHIYVSLGVVALAYSTWVTFSGPEFINRYGSPNVRAPYQIFVQRQPNLNVTNTTHRHTLQVLQIYYPSNSISPFFKGSGH